MCAACCHEIQNIFHGTRGSTNFKITKMAGYVKEIDVVNESDEKIQRVLQEKDAQNTRKSTKLAIQAFRDLQTAEESVGNLDKRLAKFFANYFFIFCMNILVFRYNISFIDPPLGGFGEKFPSVTIFPSG